MVDHWQGRGVFGRCHFEKEPTEQNASGTGRSDLISKSWSLRWNTSTITSYTAKMIDLKKFSGHERGATGRLMQDWPTSVRHPEYIMRYLPVVLLAVIGMLPSGLLPVMVSAAHGRLGFTVAQSASLGAATIFCTAIGALAVALVGVPPRWKSAAAIALATLCLLDLASMAIVDVTALLMMRATHGLVGGILTGIGYATISRSPEPDRVFGLLLALQFLVAGIAIAVLPALIAAHGMWLLFAVLASVSGLTLSLVPFTPDLAIVARAPVPLLLPRLPSKPMLLGLAALLLIEAGHTAASAFMLDLGLAHSTPLVTVQMIVGSSAIAGLIGASGVATLGTRYGRSRPLLCAGICGIASGLLLLLGSPVAFGAGAMIGSIAWAFSVPLVLGGCAAIDPKRGDAVWLSFVAKVGLAIGPLLGTLVVSGNRFEPAILLSIGLGLAGLLIFLQVERHLGRRAS